MNNQFLQNEDFDVFSSLISEKDFNALNSYSQNLLRNSVNSICRINISDPETKAKLISIQKDVEVEKNISKKWELIKTVASGKITIDDIFYQMVIHTHEIPGTIKNKMMFFSYTEQRFGGIADKIGNKINDFTLSPNIHNFCAWVTIASASKKKNADEYLPQWLMELDETLFKKVDNDYATYLQQKGLNAISSFKKVSSQEWFNKNYNALSQTKKFAKWFSENPEHIPAYKEMPTNSDNFVVLKNKTEHLFFPLIVDKGYTNENFETLMMAFQKILNKNNAISKFEHDASTGTATTTISYEVQIFQDLPENYFMNLETFKSKKQKLNSICEEFKSLISLPQFDDAIKSNKPLSQFYDNNEHSHFLEILKAKRHQEELNVIITTNIQDNNDNLTDTSRPTFKL